MLIYSIGTTLGPFVGGAIAETGNWRWIFYLNLPLGGLCLLVLYVFLHVERPRDPWSSRFRNLDLVGNGILIAGSTAILVALTYADNRYSWGSWQTLVPLLLGFGAFVVFGFYERSSWAPETPLMPARLFGCRTSVILAINTFLNAALIYWSIFFLPVYFQSVQLASPRRAGVALIPLSLFGIPSAALGAVILTRFGRYKMIHLVGFILFAIGRGLYILLDEDTPTSHWVVFQLVAGVGAGLLINTLLPAFQAPLAESDQATATATWNFLRTMGNVWGVAIPAAVFSNHANALINNGAISDPVAAHAMANGGAYQFASAEFIHQFSQPVQQQIRAVYRSAIQRVWVVSFAFLGIALLLVLFEKDIPLRKVLETKYGMRNGGQTKRIVENPSLVQQR
jgi:MFS family permease